MRIAVVGATGRVGRHVVELAEAGGHEVARISPSAGVDVVTGDGLAVALRGADAIVDVASGRSPDQGQATGFFEAAAANLQREGRRAGVRRIVAVSIIGVDRFTVGYNAAKRAHELATLAGPVPARVLRAAQFHEFVPQLMEWGRAGEVTYVPRMRTQLVAARAVAARVVELAAAVDAAAVDAAGVDAAGEDAAGDGTITEIAGPREERLAEMARLLAARSGLDGQVMEVEDPADPDAPLYEAGALLPGPAATLAGPTFADWLAATLDTEEWAAVGSRLDSARH